MRRRTSFRFGDILQWTRPGAGGPMVMFIALTDVGGMWTGIKISGRAPHTTGEVREDWVGEGVTSSVSGGGWVLRATPSEAN